MCLSEFFFKSFVPSGKKKEKKRERKNFAKRQIVYAPFVAEMALLALAQHKEPMCPDRIHRRSRCLQLLQLRDT